MGQYNSRHVLKHVISYSENIIVGVTVITGKITKSIGILTIQTAVNFQL